MNAARIFAIVGYAWFGDIAMPVSLVFVYDETLARDLVEDELEDLSCRVAFELYQETAGQPAPMPTLRAVNGSLPAAWRQPTLRQILSITLY